MGKTVSDDDLLEPSRPWWIKYQSTDDDNGQKNLCKVCGHIDFAWLLYNDLPGTDSDDAGKIRLGRLEKIVQKEFCTFCRLVIRTICTALGEGSPPVIVDGKPIYCELHSGLVFRDSDKRELYQISIWVVSGDGFIVKKTQGVTLDIQLLHDPPFTDSALNLGRKLQGSRTDFGLLKEWLHLCDETHSVLNESDSALTELPNKFRVVDIQKRCLVQVPKNCRYVALSYIWGDTAMFRTLQDNKLELEKAGSLSWESKSLPRTIQDAIYLVEQIDERYIWIDSLCIIQDDEADKTDQISAMGSIYGELISTSFADVESSV